jgi:hypothetical protein
MNAFKYGIGEPGRAIAGEFTPQSRPMFRNAMTRVLPQQKSAFVKEYFSFKNPESAEAFAKIFVNSKNKVVYTRRPVRYLTIKQKSNLKSIPENKQLRKRTRKQRTRKNRG